MSSEEELLRLQKILAAVIVIVALSVGVGGFGDFAAWHGIEYKETTNRIDDYGEYGSQSTSKLTFTLKEIEYEYESTDNDGDTYDDSQNFDYGEYGIFEELEKTMPNIEKGGYLVIILIVFVIWRLQEMKAETSEEIRTIVFNQMTNALKAAGVVVVLVSLYYFQGSGFEDDFDVAFTSEEEGIVSADCDEAWINKPEFKWSGTSKFSYDNMDCPDASYYYTDTGSGEFDISPKSGFYLFVGSAILLFWAFQILSKSQFTTFSVPSVPNIPVQGMAVNPPPPFMENKPVVHRKVTVQRKKETTYQEPEISVMAIPEDEND